jgi:Domain of unknown function (DUF4389)
MAGVADVELALRGLSAGLADPRRGRLEVYPMASRPPYPARLDAALDPGTSRWLWLVKWLLVLPHLVVLVFLWLAMMVLTVVAGVNIAITGRYPRSIFDFNVGVMRWTWRVSYYSIGAFGTDRYPPFSLASDPSYPADFTVDYPQQLSRGLVWVKWWLLALPQLLIVAILTGGFGIPTGNLVALLAVIAAAILMVTRRYPQDLFDLLIGFNRWSFRVLAYCALMRDEYPPFRLDIGGTDPGHLGAEPTPPAPQPMSAAVR